MTRLALFALLAATPAFAQDTMSIGNPIGVGGYVVRGPSTVTLAPTDRPGALAQVTFDNVAINNAGDTGTTATLTIPGMSVDARFEWETDMIGSDTVTITPPEGVECVPSCVMQVPESSAVTIWLFAQELVGA